MTYLSIKTQYISEFRKFVKNRILINCQKLSTRKGGAYNFEHNQHDLPYTRSCQMNTKIIVVTLYKDFYATPSNVVSSMICACNL
jgi:hypothetical protein